MKIFHINSQTRLSIATLKTTLLALFMAKLIIVPLRETTVFNSHHFEWSMLVVDFQKGIIIDGD